jgi:hypothetical protein
MSKDPYAVMRALLRAEAVRSTPRPATPGTATPHTATPRPAMPHTAALGTAAPRPATPGTAAPAEGEPDGKRPRPPASDSPVSPVRPHSPNLFRRRTPSPWLRPERGDR